MGSIGMRPTHLLLLKRYLDIGVSELEGSAKCETEHYNFHITWIEKYFELLHFMHMHFDFVGCKSIADLLRRHPGTISTASYFGGGCPGTGWYVQGKKVGYFILLVLKFKAMPVYFESLKKKQRNIWHG